MLVTLISCNNHNFTTRKKSVKGRWFDIEISVLSHSSQTLLIEHKTSRDHSNQQQGIKSFWCVNYSHLSISTGPPSKDTQNQLQDLSTQGFWYPLRSWNQSPTDTEKRQMTSCCLGIELIWLDCKNFCFPGSLPFQSSSLASALKELLSFLQGSLLTLPIGRGWAVILLCFSPSPGYLKGRVHFSFGHQVLLCDFRGSSSAPSIWSPTWCSQAVPWEPEQAPSSGFAAEELRLLGWASPSLSALPEGRGSSNLLWGLRSHT